jgi:hypothetical protein
VRVTCPCGVTWSAGTGVQHCTTGCHQTFRSVTLADAHRTPDGVCLTPDQMRGLLGMWQNNEGQWDR